MKFVRDELGRIYPLCQSTYSEVYLYLRFVLETNEKTLFHKKKKRLLRRERSASVYFVPRTFLPKVAVLHASCACGF